METFRKIIATHRDDILTHWLAAARGAASARGLDQPALLNIMPQYLSSLAAGTDGAEYVERHFSTRLRQGFQLAEIVEEFTLLGRAIVTTSFERAVERLDASDIDLLYRTLQRAAAAVVALFDEHMREDEQLDKRYARLLREVAGEALDAGIHTVASALPGLLEVVTEAMGARAAAILLRDTDTRLGSAATVGGDALHAYVTHLDDEAAASRPAELPASVWEVACTQLEVPATLQASGILALLAVRLRSRSGLLGEVYVGIEQRRTFSSREMRRLEALAVQLVAHLDTVTLLGRLSETITTLQKEQTIREQFVSVLAHDLRGPLAAARLGADLLSQQPESLDERRELAIRVGRNLDRLDRMIRDLLDANRIGAGQRLPLRLDICDLQQIAEEVAEELRLAYGDRFVVDGEPTFGVWSAEELRRTLWNLGTNAVKHGVRDRPITFAIRRVEAGVRVAVHNWGPPIDADELPHLFEPFSRARETLARGRPGWGLGLTLVLGCVQAHGGTVAVTSNAEEGTTFTLDLPLDARPHHAEAIASRDGTSPSVH